MNPQRIRAVTIVIKSPRDVSQLAYLARALRESAALNHGYTVIDIEHPNGDHEYFSVYAGRNGEEHQKVLSSYNWSKH